MDYRAVYTFLCMLIAQASCIPLEEKKARALNATIQLMRAETQTALDELAKIQNQLPSISCPSLNISEMVGQEQHLLTADNLSLIRCYMMKMSGLTPEVASQLQTLSQYTKHVERQISDSITQRECRQPTNNQDIDNYVFVRCLLELLDQKLSEG